MNHTKNRIKELPFHDEHPDHNLQHAFWWNQDKAQSHYFVSILDKHYPQMKEGWPVKTLICPPNKIMILPHRYYTINSRDAAKINGAWVKEEAIHEFPPTMLTRGGALGHE